MTDPQVSVIVATYNSEDRITDLMASLASQHDEWGNPWGDRLQVLCVDGGSTDSTREVVLEAGWILLDNPAGDPVSAKVIGWESASSDLVCFIDHDEVLLRSDSIARRKRDLALNPKVVAAFCSGYLIDNLNPADAYLSEFGDAFSCFAYKSRNNSAVPNRLGHMQFELDTGEAKIYATPKRGDRVLLEIAAQGVLVSRTRLASALGHKTPSRETFLRGVGLTDLADSSRFAIAKDDPVGHQPRASWSTIRAKGRWRLRNNLDSRMSSGASFRKREGNSVTARIVLRFAIHIVTLVPLLTRAVKLSVASRKNYFFGHIYLSLALCADAPTAFRRQEQTRYGA